MGGVLMTQRPNPMEVLSEDGSSLILSLEEPALAEANTFFFEIYNLEDIFISVQSLQAFAPAPPSAQNTFPSIHMVSSLLYFRILFKCHLLSETSTVHHI